MGMLNKCLTDPSEIDANADYSYSKLDQLAYNRKREEILQQFTKDFLEGHYNYDPMFRAILETLVRGGNPYSIIEELIKDRKSLYEKLLKREL